MNRKDNIEDIEQLEIILVRIQYIKVREIRNESEIDFDDRFPCC